MFQLLHGACIMHPCSKNLILQLLKKATVEEAFLQSLKTPRETNSLKQEEQLALNLLKKRKDLVEVVIQKTIALTLTGLGKKLAEQKISTKNIIDRLTPEHLKLGHWKKSIISAL